ncbi:uncharacterized protein LOC113396892 [Vanessa tameamea]|uniref:Uncharacterized protein LOC113396892 n=1 Tax=Vanessa tameamea TaxID=334116 RepID=A0ABM4AT04_VANTA
MSALTLSLSIVLCFVLVVNIECAVIKMQEIPLNKDVVMKIVVKEDSQGDSVAMIKISTDHKKANDKELLPKIHEKSLMPASDFVPALNDRHGIVNGNCPFGKVRRGPICTYSVADTEHKASNAVNETSRGTARIMSALTLSLSIVLCLVLVVNIECAVIKMQEIRLNKDVVMKIVVKEDSDGDLAMIKISTDHKKTEDKPVPKLEKFVMPASDVVPVLGTRLGILNGNCPLGKVRRGPICT